MENKTIYSKTARGMREAANKTKDLPRNLRNVLKAVDGKSDFQALLQALGGYSGQMLEQAIEALVQNDYIRKVESVNSPPPAQPRAPSSLVTEQNDVGDGLDELDFTSIADVPAESSADEKMAVEKARQEAAEIQRREAEAAKRRQEAETAAQRKLAEDQARKAAEEKLRQAAAEKARQEAEAEARRQAEEKARKEAEEQQRREAEARAKQEAEIRAQREAEESRLRQEAERLRLEAEAKAKQAAEEKARQEAESAKLRKLAEEQAQAEEKLRQAAAAKARQEAEAEARRQAEAKAKQETEARAQREADEARVRAEAERLRLEAEAKAKQEAEEKARQEAESAKLRKFAEDQARKAAEEKLRQAAAEKARQEAEAEARRQAEEKARKEAEEQQRREAEARARQEAEIRAQREAEEARLGAEAERLRLEAELKEKLAAEEMARKEAEEIQRREAEAQAQREAEAEAARRDAAEQQRRAAEENQLRQEAGRLRLEAEAKAMQAAEVKARKAAEEQHRLEDAAREAEARAQRLVEEEAAVAADKLLAHEREPVSAEEFKAKKRRTRKLVKAAIFALVAGVAIVHVIPFGGQLSVLEKSAATQFGQPVKASSLNFWLFPTPHWRLRDVSVGDHGQIRASLVKARTSISALFGSQAPITALDIESAQMDAEGVAWILLRKGQANGLGFSSITAKDVKVNAAFASLPVFDANATVDANGNWQKLELKSPDQKFSAELNATGDGASVKLNAAAYMPPLGLASEAPVKPAGLVLGNLTATGQLSRREFVASEFSGETNDGYVTGKARLGWDAGWTLSGEVKARMLDTAAMFPALSEGGVLGGSGSFVMRGADPSALLRSIHAEGNFLVERGAVHGIDLGRVLRGVGSGGRTAYSALDGKFSYRDGKTQLRNVIMAADQLTASGNADVTADKQINGRFLVELKSPSMTARSSVSLAGTLDNPRFGH